MKTPSFFSGVALLLIITFIFHSAFFLAPQRTHATGWPVFDAGNFVQNTISAIKSVLIEVHAFTTAVATYALWVNTFILQPLLFVLSGRLLQRITSGVLQFVTGVINGTGAPQFAQNVRGTMQMVSDVSAFAFINQYGLHSRSPFSASIVSALRIDYLQSSSLAGFFAANRDTLYRTSPNINAYLAGDWSQGGVASWFALTTQDNNNPYMLYLNAQSQRQSLAGPGIGGATGARKSELSWGQGMLSWCGTDDSVDPAVPVSGVDDGTGTAPGTEMPDSITSLEGKVPGDPCTNKDGTGGKVKTPGSVINSSLSKALGATQDKIVEMGSLANEVNGILRDITRVMQTVNLAKNILVGPDNDGLLGAGRSDNHDTTVFLGVTNANVYQNAADSQNDATNRVLLSEKTNSVDQYESAWNIIKASADSASTALNTLISSCASTTVKSSAQAVLTSEVQPTLAAATSAAAVVTAARAMIQQIQEKLDSGADASADIQKLIAMPPSSTDLTNALQDAQTSGGATANPEGSLTVSGGSMVDRMNLIRTNATALASTTCSAL